VAFLIHNVRTRLETLRDQKSTQFKWRCSVVTPCRLVGGYQRHERISSGLLPKGWYVPTSLHCVTTQNNVATFTIVRTSNLTAPLGYRVHFGQAPLITRTSKLFVHLSSIITAPFTFSPKDAKNGDSCAVCCFTPHSYLSGYGLDDHAIEVRYPAEAKWLFL
jgi:hypothetical protein